MHRRRWIDYARGFVILYVVYRHTLSGLIDAGVDLDNVIYVIQEASMPIFFIVSGVFIHGSIEKRGLSSFVKLKFNTLMYPYFIWAGIHLTLQIVFNDYVNSDKNALYYLFVFVFPRALDQFWYLYTLFAVMILFAVLNVKLFHFRRWPNALTAFIMYNVAFFVSTDWFAVNDILLYYMFLVFGFLMAEYLLPVQNKFFNSTRTYLLVPVYFLLLYVWYTNYADASRLSELPYDGFLMFIPLTVITALMIFLLSNQLDKAGIFRALRYIGSHSLYIYIMHLIVTGGLRTLLLRLFPEMPGTVLLVFIMTGGVLIPILVYQAMVRMRLSFLFEPPVPVKTQNLVGSKFQ